MPTPYSRERIGDSGAAFREATDQLMSIGVPLSRVAERLRVSENTVNRARMVGRHARAVPYGWRGACAALAFEYAQAHERHAEGALSVWRDLSKRTLYRSGEMNEQRAPCPFCGEVLRLYASSNGTDAHFVECGNCGASGPGVRERVSCRTSVGKAGAEMSGPERDKPYRVTVHHPDARAPTPPIGVTMYLCRATRRLLCERHRDACCTFMPLFRQAHAAFTTLSSEGCAVCDKEPVRCGGECVLTAGHVGGCYAPLS